MAERPVTPRVRDGVRALCRFETLIREWRELQHNEDAASDNYQTWSVRQAIGQCADDLEALLGDFDV